MDTLLSRAQCIGTIVHAIFNMYLKLNPFLPPKKNPKSGFQDIAGSLFLLESLDETPEAPIGDHQGKRATRGSFFGWDGTSENQRKERAKFSKGSRANIVSQVSKTCSETTWVFRNTERDKDLDHYYSLFFDHNFLLGWTCECTFLMINIYCIRLEYQWIFHDFPPCSYAKLLKVKSLAEI